MTVPPVVPGLERPEVIGRGGYGTVYAVHEPEFGRRVALKVLAERIDGDDVRRSFARECQAMGALSGHPHIVTVYRGGATARGEPFIVMDLLSGGSLGDRLRSRGPLPWAEVVEVGVVLAGALETAHRAGILHLDIKPANVLISRFGDAVLSDFGISRMPGITNTLDGRVRASAAYTAPERLTDGAASAAVDLYALGATLFALLTGRPAFIGDTGEDFIATISRVVTEPVPDLRRRGVPSPVAEVIERLMAKEPGQRFASAAQVAAALQAAQRALGQPETRAVIEGARLDHGDSVTWPARTLPTPADIPRPASGPGAPAWAAPADVPPPASGARASAWAGPADVPRPVSDSDAAQAGRRVVPATAELSPGPTTPTPRPGRQSRDPVAPSPDESAPTVVGRVPSRPPAPPIRRRARRRGPGILLAVIAAAVVAGFGATGAVLFLTPRSPTPTPAAAGIAPAASTAATPPASSAPAAGAVLADGVTGPDAAAAQQVLSGYVDGIDDARYADAFALFSPDSLAARGGLPSWQRGESTTRISDARIVDVTRAAGGDLVAEMTFTSTQAAQHGPGGQTCTHWDLTYDLVGTGSRYLIRSAKPVTAPQPC